MESLYSIKANEIIEVGGPLTVRGNIGSGAKVTVVNGSITAVNVGRCATVLAHDKSTFSGNIGSGAKVTVHNGGVTAVNVDSSATVLAHGTSTFSGSIGSNAAVTVRNGGVTAVSVGRNAIVRAEGPSTFSGNIGSNAEVTVANGNLTVGGNIESRAKINLNGGSLHIRGTISPDCIIIGASNLSDYTRSTEVNGNSSMIANDGSVNFIRCNGSSFISGSKKNTTTITDSATGKQIKICQDPSSGEITVNGHKMPFRNKHQLVTEGKGSKLMVNGCTVEINDLEVRVDGQLVVDGVIQATPQPAVSAPNKEYNIESTFSSTGPAFLGEKKNENKPLLQQKSADNERCCCAVM